MVCKQKTINCTKATEVKILTNTNVNDLLSMKGALKMKKLILYLLTGMMMSMAVVPAIAEKSTNVTSYYADTDAVYLNLDGLQADEGVDVSSAEITLLNKENLPVEADVKADGNTVIITPSSALSTGQVYTVEANGLKTTDNVAISDYVKSFKIVEILKDDFEGSEIDKEKWTATDGVTIDNNKLKLHNDKNYRVFSKNKFLNKNYSVTFEAELLAGERSYDGKKISQFNVYTEKSGESGDNTQYAAGFNYIIDSSNYTLVSRNESWGEVCTLVSGKEHNENIETNTRVKIMKQNSKGLYKVGNASSTYDSPYDLDGYIGFESFSGEWSNTTAWIDNFLVTTVEEVIVSENANVASYYADVDAVYLNISGVENGDALLTSGIVLKDRNGNVINTTVTADGNTLIVVPNETLETGVKYTIEASEVRTENGGIVPAYEKSFLITEVVNEKFSSNTVGADTDYEKPWCNWGTDTYEVADGRLKMKGAVIRRRDRLPSKNYSIKLDLYNDNPSANGKWDNDIRISASKHSIKDGFLSSNYEKGLNYLITAQVTRVENYVENYNSIDVVSDTEHNILFSDDAIHVNIVNQNGNGKYKLGENNVYRYTYNDIFSPGYFGFILSKEAKWSADNILITCCADWIDGVDDGKLGIEIKSTAKVTEDNGNTSVNVNVNVSNNNCENHILFAAAYDEAGKMAGIGYGKMVKTSTTSEQTITISNVADAKTIKVMAWSNLREMIPVANTMSAVIE